MGIRDGKYGLYASNSRIKGDIGEDIACIFLANKGFEVICRNYRKKWAELDIVALKDGILHFFEVKSVTLHGTIKAKSHRPEENVHEMKIDHIRRGIATYLAETRQGIDVEFHFHVLCVYMNLRTRRASVKWLEDLVI